MCPASTRASSATPACSPKAGARLPRGVKTRTPEDVAAATARAIDHDVAEIDVAPLPLRISTMFANSAPDAAAALARVLGSDRVSQELEDGHSAAR